MQNRLRVGQLYMAAVGLIAVAALGCDNSQPGSTDSAGGSTTGSTSTDASGGPGTSSSTTTGSKDASAAGKPARIVVVTNGFSAFWDSMNKGRQDAAAQYKVETDWEGPPHAQAAEQKELMEQAGDKGFNCLAVSAVEASTIGPVIDELTSRGVKVITFDSDAPKSKRIIYIGTDNRESGEEAGRAMVGLLPHGGNVWGFVGNLSAENARERRDGFLDAVKGHNINLVAVIEDNKDASAARKNVENILQSKGSQIQALLGFYSYNLPAISEAVKRAGLRKNIKIVGFDAEPGTLTALQSGGVDATVVQKPYEFGRLSIEFLTLAQKDGPEKAKAEWNSLNPDFKLVGDKINTGVRVVTPANIQPFLAELKKWGVTSS